MSEQQLEALRLERKIVFEERDEGILHYDFALKFNRTLIERSISVGDEQWKHAMKKKRLDETGAIRLGDLDTDQFSKGLVCLYEKVDALNQKSKRKRNNKWRENTIIYYDGERNDDIWCHLSGTWQKKRGTKAAHIVPHFLDPGAYGEALFGSRVHSLDQPSNSLLMSTTIKSWFDKYLCYCPGRHQGRAHQTMEVGTHIPFHQKFSSFPRLYWLYASPKRAIVSQREPSSLALRLLPFSDVAHPHQG